MKITELKNCPQWLLDAKTENADVEVEIGGKIIWHSGIWWGGDWRGGDWQGGVWWGGYSSPLRAPYVPLVNKEKKTIKFGCLEKTVDEWEKFDEKELKSFSKDQLKQLKISFELAKRYLELIDNKTK